MIDIENVFPRPRLPVVKIEPRIVLKVNTPKVQFKPSLVPILRHHCHINTPADTQTAASSVLAQSHKEKKKESSESRLISRRWESTDKKHPVATPITVTDIRRLSNGNDCHTVDILAQTGRSRSAPTKLFYLDKTGHITPSLKDDKKHFKSSRCLREKCHNNGDAIRNGWEISKSKSNSTSSSRKEECGPYEHVKRAWDGSDVSLNDKRRIENERKSATTLESCSVLSESELFRSNTGTFSSVSYNESGSMSKAIKIVKHSHKTCDSVKVRRDVASRPTPFHHKNAKTDTRVLKHLREVFNHEHRHTRSVDTLSTPSRESEDKLEAAKEFKREVSDLFHNAIHFVRMVIRLLSSMTDLSAEMTSRSATEERWHTLNTSRQAREMAFNKTAFAKRKGFYKLPRWAKVILEKVPDERTDADLRRIHALLRGLKSFDKFTEKIQMSMCRSFTYHSVESGRIVLRQGHVGVNFYFLYTGSVFVNTDDTDAHGNKFSKTEVVLRRGDSFGELALLQDIRRTATISCREDCELLVVDKDTFAKVCPKIFEKEMEEKVKFISGLPLFSSRFWPKETMEKMCFEAQIQEIPSKSSLMCVEGIEGAHCITFNPHPYKTNKVLVSNNTKEDWIYLCMSGKCQIIRRLNLGEEIHWRKLQQSVLDRIETQRNRSDHRSDHRSDNDTLDYRTSISEKVTSCDEDDRRSFIADLDEGKERMLESMGLEYRNARKLSIGDVRQLIDLQKSYRQNSKQELEARSKSPVPEQGPMTLTSVIKRDGSNFNDYLYLNIKVLEQGEVFDLSTVINCKRDDIDMKGSYMLVSNGARVMRIKRSSFFKYATPEALQHARKVTKRDRFPSDDVLLRCYRDQLNWQVYKHMVLKDTFSTMKYKKENSLFMPPSVTDSETQAEINDVNKRTIKELEHVLPADDKSDTDVQSWQKLETLTNKSTKKPNKHRVTFKLEPEREIRIRVSQAEEVTSLPVKEDKTKPNSIALSCYIGQRRGSVATGDLRRENLHNQPFGPKRRLSQPTADFMSIQEEVDGSGSDC